MKPQTNRETVDCFLAPEGVPVHQAEPGAFRFDDDYSSIEIMLPGRKYVHLPLDGTRGWRWDGNKERPTISPSILTFIDWGREKERIELWHGFMRSGRLESC